MKRKIFIFSFFTFFLVGYTIKVFSQDLPAADINRIKEYKKTLETAKATNQTNKAVYVCVNISNLYLQYDKIKESTKYLEEAINLLENSKNKSAKYKVYNQLGFNYLDLKQFDKASESFRKAAENIRTIDRRKYISAQINYASALVDAEKYQESIKVLNELKAIALEEENLYMLRRIYGLLSSGYEKIGDKEKQNDAFYHYRIFDEKIKELEINRQKQIAAIEHNKRMYVEKEKILVEKSYSIQRQISENALKEINLLKHIQKIMTLELHSRKVIIDFLKKLNIIFAISLLVFLLLIIGLFVLIKQKKTANRRLNQANIELERKNELILKQNKDLEEKNKQIEAHRRELSEKNKKITDAINYASRIQKAILPSHQAIISSFPDAMIFYLPKDIVSGDFYWYSNKGGYYFVAAVDCTGHSVPGAFMSMIGNTLLNEIVNSKNIYDPAEILNQLNKSTIETLVKEVESEDISDGMDITLIRVDYKNNEAVIAAANHKVIYFNGDKMQTIEGDIYSIGHSDFEMDAEFSNHVVNFKPGDTFYMFSDGYADQFGGKKARKFLFYNFVKLLDHIHNRPMKEQYEILLDIHNDWRGDLPQIDDILVIGIKL